MSVFLILCFAHPSKIWHSILTVTAQGTLASETQLCSTAVFQLMHVLCGVAAAQALLQALGQRCSQLQAHPYVSLRWSMLCRTSCQVIQTPRSWKSGLIKPFLSFQLKVVGLLEKLVQESAHKSQFSTYRLEMRKLLLNTFCVLNEEHCSESPSFTCLSDGRARATPIAAAQDGKWDNTLKRWPRMKRLDESHRTFPGLTNRTLQ